MGFGEAFINILLVTQWVLNFPIVYDKKLDQLISNPNISKWWKMLRWRIGNLFISSVWLYSIVHLFFMKRNNPDASSKAFKEELLVYVFTIAICTQAVLTFEAVSRNPTWFAYVEGQILRAYDVRYRGWPTHNRKPDPFEAASYILAGGFILFPFLATVLPIIRSYDPINQMFLTFVPFDVDPRIRFGSVIILYLLSVSFGALSCLNIVLLTASHCFIATRLAQRNVEISMSYLNRCHSLRHSHIKDPDRITQTVSRISSVELRNLKRVFQKRRQFYVQVKLITATVNSNMDYYVPGMLSAAMVLCSFCYFGVIEFHNRLPKTMIAGMAFIALFVNALTINLIGFASHPMTKAEAFAHFWKKANIGKLERKQVKALVPVFFGMGKYFSIKKSTALDIMHTILEYTINALMG